MGDKRKMTEYEILKIKEHIEIHARREPRAIKITQILWKAVEELESTKELQKENARLKEINTHTLSQLNLDNGELITQLTKARNLLQKVTDVCGYPNYDIPVELYSEIADFLKDSEVEK